MTGLHHTHDTVLVLLSVVIAVFASYTSLTLANNIMSARSNARKAWWVLGSLAMGIGIWSMHFVAMLAFRLPSQLPEIAIAYDISLMAASVVVAILASGFALWIVSRELVTSRSLFNGSLLMGTAIAGMHYLGIASMQMAVVVSWNPIMVLASIAIAYGASYVALKIAVQTRLDYSKEANRQRLLGSLVMGFAVSGMHFTGMAAMRLSFASDVGPEPRFLLATEGLAFVVIFAAIVILGIALAGSIVDRALKRRGRQERALRDAIRARDEFLSIASHELKTPITSLKLQTQMRQRALAKGDLSYFSGDKLARGLDADLRQIERLQRLIDDMLDISRIGNGKLSIHTEQFDLRDLVADVVERFSGQFHASGCLVNLEDNGPIVGYWDRFRIEQVLTNLLTNAIRYGAGKPVYVVAGMEGDGQAYIRVRDEGLGIHQKDHKRIFERFERAISHNEISGLGLGLYIVKQIVEMHRGQVSLHSQLGAGSEFTVKLPLHPGDISTGVVGPG